MAPVLKPTSVPHKILVRDTGVKMVKTSGGFTERPPMAPWALLIQYHAEVAKYCGPRMLKDVRGDCALCLGNLKDVFQVPPMGDLFVCTQCLLPWHRCCAQAYNADVTFDPFVCDLCARLAH